MARTLNRSKSTRRWTGWRLLLASLLCGQVLSANAQFGHEGIVFIEAETLAERVTSGGTDQISFGQPFAHPEASSGFALNRLHGRQPVHALAYDVSAAAPGTYTLWVRRFGEQPVNVKVGFLEEGEERPNPEALTSAMLRRWKSDKPFGWLELTEVTIEDNRLLTITFARHTDSLIDALALVPAGGPAMSDELMEQVADRPNHSQDIIDAANAYQPGLSPIWLGQYPAPEAPAWFDEARVQVHARLQREVQHPLPIRRPVFFDIAEYMASMNVKAYVRHIKSGDEGAWWPSSIGEIHPTVTRTGIDAAGYILAFAQKYNRKLIAYHRHMEDAGYAAEHPEVVTRGPGGAIFRRRGMHVSVLDQGYWRHYIDRSVELLARGASGFYMDEVHMPRLGDWSPSTMSRFQEETGLPVPRGYDTTDPVYLAYLRWYNVQMERAFFDLSVTLRTLDPESVMLIGTNLWPRMTLQHVGSRTMRLATATKTEHRMSSFGLQQGLFPAPDDFPRVPKHIRNTYGWNISRDASDGRPPHIWTDRVPLYDWSFLYITSALVSSGSIANLDMFEPKNPYPPFQPAIDLGNKASEVLAGTQPVRGVGIYFSEHSRGTFITDPASAWERVIGQVKFAWSAFKTEREVVGFITDAQILDQDYLTRQGFRAIVVPPADLLHPDAAAALERYAEEGMIVHYQDAWDWSEGGVAAVQAALRADLAAAGYENEARIVGGHEEIQGDFFHDPTDGRRVATIANAEHWVPHGERARDHTPFEYGEENRPADVSGAVVEWHMDQPPSSVREQISGLDLDFTFEAGLLSVSVPEFRHMAVVEITP